MVGAEPRIVRVEAHIGGPKERFCVVGLPDTAVREARDRVKAALISAGFGLPVRSVTVNLAPADLPKGGSGFDLPIALGVLAAAGEIPATRIVAVGELALDGGVRGGHGAMAAGILSARLGVPCLVPQASAPLAAIVDDADVWPIASLAEAVAVASGRQPPRPVERGSTRADQSTLDLAEVRGQAVARRALEIAAAGGHHLLLSGPPGVGKSMLASRLPGILPVPTPAEEIEIACCWAAADRRPPMGRPFRAPHHSASLAAMVGGGSGIPVPGEISLAHQGVLFLDELGEFPSHLLDALRQPLEQGSVVIARKGRAVEFPSRFQLIAATNPCPCGFAGDRKVACSCSPATADRYRRRLSGPLLDRFDLRVRMHRVPPGEVLGAPGEATAEVRARVTDARLRQQVRGHLNRDVPRLLLDDLEVDPAASVLLERASARATLSGRGLDRVRRVARTIADLDGCENVAEPHVAEALALREAW